MKIGFIDFVFERKLAVGSSGLSEVVWSMAPALAAMGHEVHVVGPYHHHVFPSDSVIVHAFDLPVIGYRNILGHLFIVKRAIKVLNEHGPFDVIHAPEYLSTAMLCVLNRDSPIVLTEPGNIYDRLANGNPYDVVTTQIYKLAAHISGRRCARVIATSEEMVHWWKRCGAEDSRIARIPLGVDLHGFSQERGARQQLGWDDSRKHVLFVARLSPETGATTLLRAVSGILQRCPTAQIHFIGSGPAEDELHRLAQECRVEQAVVWHGWIKLSELATYYSASDVMVFPGTGGGTPRVMLQAMACNTPFVGSKIGGIVDHVTDGETGLLFPPGDTDALVAQIASVLESPTLAGHIATLAHEYVRNLSWEAITARVAHEVYQPIVGTHAMEVA
ncbi:MAG: hypothetical protein NVSMB42_04980 [Herpetosiphon sp.]